MSERAGGRASGNPRARKRLCRTLDLLARIPARPLRRSGLHLTTRGRAVLAILLVLGLAAPLAVTSPFTALADDELDAEEVLEPGLPYWQVLRPANDEGDEAATWTDGDLKAVHFPTDLVGYAVGGGTDSDGSSYGVVLKTADGGENWTEMRLKRGDEIGVLRGVHFVNEERGFAVGDKGVIVGTPDGGDSWTRLASAVEVTLHDVHFPTPQVGYVVGNREGGRYTIFKTENGGATWIRQSDLPAGNRDLRGVHFVTATDGVAVGDVGGTARTGLVLRAEEDEEEGQAWTESSALGSAIFESVVLLEVGGLGYAVGPASKPTNVSSLPNEPFHARRSEVAFGGSATDTATEHERAVSLLRDVTAYWLTEANPVAEALDLLEPVLEEGLPDAREPLVDALRLAAETIESLPPTGADEVDEALSLLVGTLEGLASAIEEEEDPRDEIENLREEIEGLLEELDPDALGVLAAALDDAAQAITDLGPTDQEPVDDALNDLVDALRGLAEAMREANPEEEAQEAREQVNEAVSAEGSIRVELAHAVGAEGNLPVAITRPGGPHKAWIVEPIADWAAHAGRTLHGVSASPEGATVVAVGDAGLILRRTSDPNQVLCVPQEVAGPLEDALDDGTIELPEGVPVCRDDAGPRQDPEDKDVDLVDPPIIELSSNVARPGGSLTVTGENWRSCPEPSEPDEEPACVGSTVSLELRQGGNAFGLGEVQAGQDGVFTLQVAVPQQAVEGSAIVRGEGQPQPDGGPRAETPITLLAVLPPSITIQGQPRGAPGTALQIQGSEWRGACEGADCKGSTVEVVLRQGDDEFELGEAKQANSQGSFTLTATVPEEATPGPAIVHAVGRNPAPEAGRTAEAAFEILTPCRISTDDTNPELACLTAFKFQDESNEFSNVNFLQFDPGLGDAGRVVGVLNQRVFLYDADQLEQRGVPGFGAHFPAQCWEDQECEEDQEKSADETGVVKLADMELSAATESRRITLDSANHRLFMANGRTITAMSLVGEFPPTSYDLAGNVLERITHLAADGSNSMLYAATTSSTTRTNVHPTDAPQRDVLVRAIRAQVVGEGEQRRLVLGVGEEETGDEIEPSWSLAVGDLCSTTANDRLEFFGVSSDGRRLSLPCQGTDFLLSGSVQANPNGILVVILPGDTPPSELTEDAALAGGSILRRFQPVPGGGMGAHNVQRVQGDSSAGVLTWRIGGRVLVWDVDRAGWVGQIAFPGVSINDSMPNLVGVDPKGHRLYVGNRISTEDLPGGHVARFQILNLPGSLEGEAPLATGFFAFPRRPLSGAFDPQTRRLVLEVDGLMRVLEDKTPRTLSLAELDPDRRTNDIDEEDASSVNRRGETAAYGARVWWTGLLGSLPGTYAVQQSFLPNSPTRVDPPPQPGLTYEHLEGGRALGDARVGLARSPWRPHRGQRELFSARVEKAELSSSDSSVGISSGLSEAIAWGLDTGDQGQEGTGEDLRGRRGSREWRNLVGTEVGRLCSSSGFNLACHQPWSDDEDDPGFMGRWEDHWQGEDAQRFDECTNELYDRLLRELDGERRVEHRDEDGHPVDQCFEAFDEGSQELDDRSPDWFPQPHEDERPGVEERLGWTQRSRCEDGGGQTDDASTVGSTVVCDLARQSTVAAADNAISLELPGGAALDVDGSFSGTRVFRHPTRGIVSQAVGVASGVELVVPGVGRLQIGEVLARAESSATGRPGGASSEYSVAYKDVRLTSPGPGEGPGEVVVFSCDPKEDRAILAGDEASLPSASASADEGEEQSQPEAACDPEGLADAVASVFGPRVTIRAPARDLDEVATGTPGGAQAIVRLNRVDYFNDRVVLQMDHRRQELPGLQIEINADSTLANRFRVDLAAVYTESRYLIGELAPPAVVPAMVEAPLSSQTATTQVLLIDPAGSPLQGGEFELQRDEGSAGGCSTDASGECEIAAVPLGSYGLFQQQAPAGYTPAEPVSFELTEPGQVARITVVNGREGTDGSEVIEIVEILEDARPASAISDDGGGWWRRAARGLADVILRNPWVAVALALVISMFVAPGYLSARRRELSMMRELT